MQWAPNNVTPLMYGAKGEIALNAMSAGWMNGFVEVVLVKMKNPENKYA